MSESDAVDADTAQRSRAIEHTAVELEVTYDTDGEPSEIQFFTPSSG